MHTRKTMKKIIFLSVVTSLVFHHSNADIVRILREDPSSNLKMAFEWNDPGDNSVDDWSDLKQISTESTYYSIFPDKNPGRHKRAGSRRPGSATETHSCDRIRGVPQSLRKASGIGPRGLAYFYQKYTEAYGIPVVGSRVVSDDALRRACYVVRFLMADHSGVRQSYYRLSGRVAIMAASEQTTSIPEHAWLGASWNQRARGLGATLYAPVSTGAEENVRCYSSGDRYRNEDIFLHEFSHGIHLLGAKYAIPGWDSRLRSLYSRARRTGLWARTYSMSTAEEYYAEGVQSYFEVNAYSATPNGVHGPINTRAKLRSYDPALYSLITQVFPCGNTYIKRCRKDRGAEQSQNLRMNCNLGGGRTTTRKPPVTTRKSTVGGRSTTSGPVSTKKIILPKPSCIDNNPRCDEWSNRGECGINPAYMLNYCKKSCNKCNGDGGSNCFDDSEHCGYWARTGECQKNPDYMLNSCKKSCNSC